ncbi:MAG: FxsA family protein [Casimicrobiaceae bacterium]
MRFVLIAIVLIFPLIDLYLTARVARLTGTPVWGWLVAGILGGWWVLRNERMSFRANTLAALHGEQSLLRGLVDSGRKVLAGLLFMLPGVLSDALALMLLMLPINRGPQPAVAGRPPQRTPIDGDFHRLD